MKNSIEVRLRLSVFPIIVGVLLGFICLTEVLKLAGYIPVWVSAPNEEQGFSIIVMIATSFACAFMFLNVWQLFTKK